MTKTNHANRDFDRAAKPVTHDEIVTYASERARGVTDGIIEAEARVAELLKEGRFSLGKGAFTAVEAIIDLTNDSVNLLDDVHRRQASLLSALEVALWEAKRPTED